MRAVVLEKFGEPAECLAVRDVPDPIPGPGQVRVRMLASPINPSDLMMVRGLYGLLPTLPATPGFEGVGIVESAGPGLLGRLLVGRRVAALNGETGNWCEQAIVTARQCLPVPSTLATEQAAMFFVNPATAYIMTRQVLAVPTGAWLLQTAAGSALGKMVIRLGKREGFRTLNVVRRREQIEELRQLGGDAVVSTDQGNLREQVLAATGGKPVQYAIDAVAGETGTAVIGCLGEGGRLLSYGTLSMQPMAVSSRDLITNGIRIEGFWLARHMRQLSLVGKLRLVRAVSGLIEQGVLTAEVGQAFPLEKISEAVSFAERAARGGKSLLTIAT